MATTKRAKINLTETNFASNKKYARFIKPTLATGEIHQEINLTNLLKKTH